MNSFDGMEARKNTILTEDILFAILTQHPWATHFLSKPHWKSWLLHNAQKSRSGTGTNLSEQRGWRFGCVRAHHPRGPSDPRRMKLYKAQKRFQSALRLKHGCLLGSGFRKQNIDKSIPFDELSIKRQSLRIHARDSAEKS